MPKTSMNNTDEEDKVSWEKEQSRGKNNGKVRLERQVSLLGGISIIVGSMIGSGIFASPTGILRVTQSVGMSLIVWVVCGILSLFGALCYAELGTMIPRSGAEYPYLFDTYGPPVGFLYAWVSTLLRGPSSISIIALTFAEYAVQPLYPEEECTAPTFVLKTVACLGVMFLILVNCVSVKGATNVQVFFTAAKLLALAIIIVTGFVKLGQGNTEYLDPRKSFEGSTSDIFAYGIAFYQGFWAYDGWNLLNFVTEELVNPYRNLPLGILIGTSLVTIVYLLTNIAYFAVLSPAQMLSSSAVAVTFANSTLGSMAWIMPLLVCCSAIGAANGTLFGAARLLNVAGREGHTMQIFSMVNITYKTPQPATLLTGTLAIAMLIPNDFDTLVNYFSFASWIFYGFTVLAVIILRFRFPDWKRPIKVPLVLPIIFTIISVYLVIAPMIAYPEIGYLYASIFILGGLLLYYPLVYKRYSPRVIDHVTIFFQQLLQVTPTYYVSPEEDEQDL